MFPVTKTTGSRVGIATVYSSLPSTNDGGGSGATFNVTRDANLDISKVEVVTGGTGYATTNAISIAGTYIGGSTPGDNITLTPVECGTNVLPDEMFVQKVDDLKFRVAGFSTSLPFDFTALGTGTHLLKVQDPTKQTLIMIDNIIQSPLTNKRLKVTVSEAIGINTESITISAGIGSLTKGDVLRLGEEYVKVKQIGDSTFVNARTAELENTVDNDFFYDTNRSNSTVIRISDTSVTLDDNPPY